MIDADFVQAIIENSKTEVLKINGVEYASTPVTDVRKPESEPRALELATLDSLIAYLDANRDGLVKTDLMIHIESVEKVSVVSKLYGDFQQRNTYAYAEPVGESFGFGQTYDNETFIVALQTLFVTSPTRDKLINVMSNIRDEDVKTHADDGFTQVVVVKTGIAMGTPVSVPNPVLLKPFRTFREVDQPESLFVLRLKSNREAKPSAILYEADGGSWKLEAMKAIAEFLRNNIEDVTILE